MKKKARKIKKKPIKKIPKTQLDEVRELMIDNIRLGIMIDKGRKWSKRKIIGRLINKCLFQHNEFRILARQIIEEENPELLDEFDKMIVLV